VATVLNNLGLVFSSQGKYDKALEYYRKSLAIYEKALGPEHPEVAWPLSAMGGVFLDKGMPEEALEPLGRAVRICEKKTCQPEPHGRGLFGLARALVATDGDNERAIRLAAEARGVFGKTPYLKNELEEVSAWLKERGAE
jgi:tetratricopeptide (TPR) repeat protein